MMSSEQTKNGFMRIVLAVFGITLLGGCTHADHVSVKLFLTDLLRNAAAASQGSFPFLLLSTPQRGRRNGCLRSESI